MKSCKSQRAIKVNARVKVMPATIVSDMLQLFRDGAAEYQPADAGLEHEAGDPQASLGNLTRINLPVSAIFAGPGGCLVTFVDGEQFYAAGLHLREPKSRAALVKYASANGFGPVEHLQSLYAALEPDYAGQLPVSDIQ
jgi:hypothetical protein